MKPSEILKEAREIIGAPNRWTQGCFARAMDGYEIDYTDARAECFCAQGAIYRLEPPLLAGIDAEEFLMRAVGCKIPQFNDAPGRTHSEILAAFDKAIILAEQSEAAS